MRSEVWQEYTKVMVKEGDPPVEQPKAKCNRCSRLIAADPNKHDTSPLWKHYTSCVKKHEANKSQTVLNSDESGSLISWKFNQDRLREALVKMLILDELPFRCVEREGFILFMKEAQPLFKIPSRHTIRENCVKMYLTQKMHLRNFFGLKGMGRVSLKTNSWIGCNNTNFICVTAHCIDSSWNLHKNIIGFSKINSHKCDDLVSAITAILHDWRLFCCTLDNAATNDYAIKEMTTRFIERNMLLAGG